MAKLTPKPWNDPWTRAAMRQPGYRQYCFGCRAARNSSWRRLSKFARRFERGDTQPHGRVERAVARNFYEDQRNADDPMGAWHGRNV